MDKFNIEYQYQLYLQRLNLSEDMMHPQQKIQLRKTFFGASGQMLLLLRDEVTKLDEDKAVEAFRDMIGQVSRFFISEAIKDREN